MARKKFYTSPEIKVTSDSFLIALQPESDGKPLEIKNSSNQTIFSIDRSGSIDTGGIADAATITRDAQVLFYMEVI